MMGPQGSGKGTQARNLEQKLGFFYWEMGAILRNMRDYTLSNGKIIASIIDEGDYLSDEELYEVLDEELRHIPQSQGIIFDGLPRRVGQAKYIVEWLHDRGRKNLCTIFLDLHKEESVRRLLRRAEIEHRPDDTEAGIERRLAQYAEVTVPALDYMRAYTNFIDIDGRPSIPEVSEAIETALGISHAATTV